MERKHSIKSLIMYCLLVIISACNGGGSGGEDPDNNRKLDPQLTRITLQPTSVQLQVQQIRQISASGHYNDGSTADITESLNWSSDNAAVASVSNTSGNKGMTSALSAGTAHVTAEHPGTGLSTSIEVNVQAASARTLTSLTITAVNIANNELVLGSSRQLVAIGTYSDLSSATLTDNVQWSSSNEAVATVDNSGQKGVVTTVGAGETTITARDPATSISAVYTLTVTSAVMIDITFKPAPTYPSIDRRVLQLGTTQPLQAYAVFSDQSELEITDRVTWSSTTPDIVQVSNDPLTPGHVTALAPGVGRVEVIDPVSNWTVGASMTVYPPPGLTRGDTVITDQKWHRLVMVDAETNLQMTVPFEIDEFRSFGFDTDGLLYTVDNRLNGILEIDPVEKTQTLVARGWYIDLPWAAVKDDDGNYYVVDRAHNGIIKIDINGGQQLLSSEDLFQQLTDITLEDTLSGPLLVTDEGASAVFRVDIATGDQVLLSQGDQLQQPSAISVADNGDLYVTDTGSEKLLRIDPGDGTQTMVTDGLTDNPVDIDIASSGTFYIATQGVASGVNQTGGRVLAVSPAGSISSVSSVGPNDGFSGIAIGPNGNVYFGNPNVNNFGQSALIRRLVVGTSQQESVVTGRGSGGPQKVLHEAGDDLIVTQWAGGSGQIMRVNLANAKRTALCCAEDGRPPPVPVVSAIEKDLDGNILFALSWADWGVYHYNLNDGTVTPVSTAGLLTGSSDTTFLKDIAVDQTNGDIYVAISQPGSHALVKINRADSTQFGFNLNCTDGLCNAAGVVVEDSTHLLVNDITNGLFRVTTAASPDAVILEYLAPGSDNYQDMIYLGNNELAVLWSNKSFTSGWNSAVMRIDLTQPTALPAVDSEFDDREAGGFAIIQ